MGDMDGLELKPWQRTNGEPTKAFHAFTHFLALLPFERSMARAYTNHLIHCKGQDHTKLVHCIPGWNDWRFRFSWLERAAAHDADLFDRDRLRRIYEIDQMNARQTKAAMQMQEVVTQRLQQMIDAKLTGLLTLPQLAAVLDKAAVVERRSRGEATSIVKHQGEGGSGTVALDLSKLSDQQLEVFQALVQLATPQQAVPVEP
jgi:hypothetical protein